MISLSLPSTGHPMVFQHQPVRPSTPCYRGFGLPMDRSHWLLVHRARLKFARFGLAFASAPPCLKGLTSPRAMTRGLIMQKACGHSLRSLRSSVGARFQVCFTPLAGVLFAFPSRYLFAIGHRVVFSLGGRAPRIQAGFHVSGPTRDTARLGCGLRVRGCHPLRPAFPGRSPALSDVTSPSHDPREQAPGFGLPRVRSPLLARSLFVFFSSGY